ncbi:hypothetical protein SUGI_0742520 [Cryptomeria japonica]|nr:hypothetical protein SUGI_0742520 [Cryptomeria japonica]
MFGAHNGHRNTPLHRAAKRVNVEIICTLLNYNKHATAKHNQIGESTLLITSEHDHVEVVRVLVKVTLVYIILWPKEDHQTCLHVVAYGGHLAIVKLILERPIFYKILQLNMLICDIHGATPLHFVVHGGKCKDYE